MANKPASGKRPIVIRREEVVEGGHHGGAWKVAYADFVTAMMAFFLLMWLINATTEAQRRGLADYFTPNNILSHSNSGSGRPFGGRTPFDDGSLVSDRGAMTVVPGKSTAAVAPDDMDAPMSTQDVQPRSQDSTDGDPAPAQRAERGATVGDRNAGSGASRATIDAAGEDGSRAPGADLGWTTGSENGRAGTGVAGSDQKRTADAAAARKAAAETAAREKAEKASFEQATQQIREAIRADPALAAIAKQIAIDQTPEGLRIQLLDEDRLPMFPTGSSTLNDRARLVLQKISPILAKLPEDISISGHTDAAPFHGGDRSNWELSSERANATRRLLVDAGLAEGRFRSVTGNADRDLLLPADPLAAANRRIAIVALRDTRSARP